MQKSLLHWLIIFNLTLLPVIFLSSCSKTKKVVLIPDLNFEKALIKAGLDDKVDGSLTITDKIKETFELDLSAPQGKPVPRGNTIRKESEPSSKINSLVGIECFTNLTKLYCSGNQLTTLDVSKNANLTGLSCSNNQLTTLDVSKNANLTELSCSDNQLTNLDVSQNKSIRSLNCTNNNISNLNIVMCENLTDLECDIHQINDIYLIYNFIAFNKIRIGIASSNIILENSNELLKEYNK